MQAFQRLLNDDLRETSERGWAVSSSFASFFKPIGLQFHANFFDSRVKYEMHLREFLDIPKSVWSGQDHLQIGNGSKPHFPKRGISSHSASNCLFYTFLGPSATKSHAKLPLSPRIFPAMNLHLVELPMFDYQRVTGGVTHIPSGSIGTCLFRRFARILSH